MKTMNFTLAALLAGLITPSAQALTHKYPCDELVYDALTQDGKKRLQLCKSQGKINYNFGSRNGKSELDVLFPVTLAMFFPDDEYSLDLYRGNYTYTIFDNKVMVTVGEEVIADIDMREPMVNTIMKSFLPYGVPVSG